MSRRLLAPKAGEISSVQKEEQKEKNARHRRRPTEGKGDDLVRRSAFLRSNLQIVFIFFQKFKKKGIIFA